MFATRNRHPFLIEYSQKFHRTFYLDSTKLQNFGIRFILTPSTTFGWRPSVWRYMFYFCGGKNNMFSQMPYKHA